MYTVKELIEAGVSITKTAKICKLTTKEVKDIIKKDNLSIIKETFDDFKIDYICQLYKMGVSAKQLGYKFSIDKRRVQKWVEKRGILRSNSNRITFFNENFFDNIDNYKKAYWLGFLYADGCNKPQTNTVSVCLKGADHNHLVKLAKNIDLPEEKVIDGYAKLDDKIYPTASVRIYSKHICDQLTKLGCVQNKSLILTFPRWLDDNLKNHFVRGVFDGDGGIKFNKKHREWKWYLAGTYDICTEIQKIILEKTGLHIARDYISKTGKNTYDLETSGNQKIIKILTWLYKDSTEDTRLDRKYELYQELLKGWGAHSDRSIISLNGTRLTASYIESLNRDQREKLIEPILNYFRNVGWKRPQEGEVKLRDDYKKICDYEPDIGSDTVIANNIGTSICKHFCESYYNSIRRNKKSFREVWDDDESFRKLIRNRLGMNWESGEAFNLTLRMMFQGMRSSSLTGAVSIFKPNVAKFICMKYSNEGDLVGDYSAGFGARLLGAMSCNRKYLGIDPLTVPELKEMAEFYGFDCTLIQSGSENYEGQSNILDLCWSSPPYYDLEKYSNDSSQCYLHGEDHFYNEYWPRTLKNMKNMLKKDKWFGLNVNDKRMVRGAEEIFGPIIEEAKIRISRSHFNKNDGNLKFDIVYMFRNKKNVYK